ncbi:MAG: CatB-related O-acetyltransferase [Fusobacterium sp.]
MKLLDFFKRKLYVKKDIFIRSGVNFKNTIFGGKNKIGRNSDVAKSFVGFATCIGDDCYLRQCKIGKFCSIGSWVKVISGNHPLNYLMTHPIVFNDSLKKLNLSSDKRIPFKEKPYVEKDFYIEIGNDVWIGQSAEILNGIKIGNGAVIAAGAVVIKDVPPYAIVGGVPAKIIKYRFSNEEIKKLQEMKIWDKDLKWIRENADKLNDIKNFMK